MERRFRIGQQVRFYQFGLLADEFKGRNSPKGPVMVTGFCGTYPGLPIYNIVFTDRAGLKWGITATEDQLDEIEEKEEEEVDNVQ